MLYKVWESAPDRYNPVYSWGAYKGLETWNAKYTTVFGLWTNGERQGESASQVYIMGETHPNNIFLLKGHMAKWDGTTGDLLWSDISTYSVINFSWAFRQSFITDDENRVWVHYISGGSGGVILRSRMRTTSINETAGAAGMPDLNSFDLSYYDGEWLNEDGTDRATPSFYGTLFGHLGVSNRGDWIAVQYPAGRGYLAIHNLSDKRRRGYIRLRDAALKGVVIDSETLYVFTSRGTVEVIDVPRLNNLGSLVLGDYRSPEALYSGVAVGYDRVYRRLLTFRLRPDDPITGQCTSIVEGWALDEVGERLTKPLPLKAPKVGRSVPVIGRVYGWEGRGIGGGSVQASLLLGNGTIGPSSKSADSNGVVQYIWVPDSEGVDSANIQLTTVIEQASPSLGIPEQVSYVLPAPTAVVSDGQEELMFPGFWLYAPSSTRIRSQTLSQYLSTYLSDYDPLYDEETGEPLNDPPDSNWKGVLIEYSWYEIETSASSYNFTAMDADVAYAASKGLKVIVAINSTNPVVDGQAWIPNYITGDSFETYGESPTAPGMKGVFAPQYTDITQRGLTPLITNNAVAERVSTLASAITGHYVDDETFTGVAPLDHCNRDDRTFNSRSGINYSSWIQARKDVLQQAKASTKLVFEWTGPQSYYTSDVIPESHASWCADVGVGLLAPKFPANNLSSYTRYSTSRLTDNDHKVLTGVALHSSSWSSSNNLDCNPEPAQIKFNEMVFGGINLVDSDTGCSKYYLERALPWMVFVDPVGGQWSTEETGIRDTVSFQRLARDLGYNN